jgi:hypothetical protein
MGLAGVWINNPKVLAIFIGVLFLALLIPIYAIIHMVLSLTGKIRPMGIVQRIVWIVLWIAAICTAIPLGFTITEYRDKYYQEHYIREDIATYQDIDMSEEDADFLRRGSWDIIKADYCDHYTWCGNDYLGNPNVRFLDTFNEKCEEVFQAERKEKVEPGIYELSCFGRAEGPGAFVYAIGNEKMLQSIPVNEGTVGNIGDGWNRIIIEKITVTGDSIVYGVSCDKAFTGEPCRAKWFSAMDFKLTRVEDAPTKK